MDVWEAMARVRTALAKVQESGQETVPIPALLEFLGAVEREAPLDSETRKLQHDSNLAFYRAQQDHAIEMLRAVFDAAKGALTTSILINGGASVALLALLGTLIGKPAPAPAAVQAALGGALLFFAVGVLAGAVATGLTYLAQYCYAMAWRRTGIGFHVATVTFVVLAYLAFLGGTLTAYCALVKV